MINNKEKYIKQMPSLYDRADIYDLFEDENRYNAYKKHWEAILENKDIHSMLDVSIGSGSVTLPIMDLGVKLSGSDLSETMLGNCQKKADSKQKKIELQCSDFRDLSCWKDRKFDCVASTGNSLGYVCNVDALRTLERMDLLVKNGGYLYFDTRNWDKILKEKNRFYLYNPMYHGENRVNVVQVWDYNGDGTITFNILYTFEKDNRIFQKEIFEECYHPIGKEMLISKLQEMGYVDIEIKCFPAYFEMVEFKRIDWYCVIARKPERR